MDSSETVACICFATVVIFLMILILRQRYSRACSMLAEWSAKNGYEVVRKERRHLRRGPYWVKSQGQTILRVILRDEKGAHHSGWARCGGFWFGSLSNVVEMRWDDPPPPTPKPVPSADPLRDRWLDGDAGSDSGAENARTDGRNLA